MAGTFLFFGWIGLGFWVMSLHRDYLEANSVRLGLDRKGAPLGGLKPILPTGLLLGLSLAWVGPLATVVLAGTALLSAFLVDRVWHFKFYNDVLPSLEATQVATKESSAF